MGQQLNTFNLTGGNKCAKAQLLGRMFYIGLLRLVGFLLCSSPLFFYIFSVVNTRFNLAAAVLNHK